MWKFGRGCGRFVYDVLKWIIMAVSVGARQGRNDPRTNGPAGCYSPPANHTQAPITHADKRIFIEGEIVVTNNLKFI